MVLPGNAGPKCRQSFPLKRHGSFDDCLWSCQAGPLGSRGMVKHEICPSSCLILGPRHFVQILSFK